MTTAGPSTMTCMPSLPGACTSYLACSARHWVSDSVLLSVHMSHPQAEALRSAPLLASMSPQAEAAPHSAPP